MPLTGSSGRSIFTEAALTPADYGYCFARRTHPYLGFDAGRDFEREIVVKVNVPEVLRTELGRRTWKRELVAIGTNTDPYQWVEGRYELMPPTLEALRDADTPVSVLTKSPLALRDIDLFAEMAQQAGATFVGSAALHLRGEVRDVFFGWLEAKRPDLLPRYENLYANGAYLPPTERKRLGSLVKGWGKNRRRSSAGGAGGAVSGPRGPRSTAGKRAPRDRTRGAKRQGSLF